MLATIKVIKSFERDVTLFKNGNIESGVLEEFFKNEGVYMENLADMLRLRGKVGDSFSMAYIVTVTK